MILNSPSKTQQLDLVSIMNLGYPLQQNQNQEKIGQKSTKVCRKCKEEKSIDCFNRRGEGNVKNRINIYCKECQALENSILRRLKKTAPPMPTHCQCCGLDPLTNENLSPLRKTLQLDHDHQTGKFRGWICDNCNVSLARAGDNFQGVLNLIKYLLTTL